MRDGSAGIAHPSGHPSARGGTLDARVMEASNSPVAENQDYMRADLTGDELAERGSLLHGRVYHQDAITSGFGNARFARVPVGRIRVGLYDTGGKVHTSETTVAGRQRLRLAIRLP